MAVGHRIFFLCVTTVLGILRSVLVGIIGICGSIAVKICGSVAVGILSLVLCVVLRIVLCLLVVTVLGIIIISHNKKPPDVY